MRPSRLILALAAVTALAACKRVETPKAPPPAAPFRYAQTTSDAEVRLGIAPAIGRWPTLHKKLYNEGKAELERFAASARTDRADLARQGFVAPAYSHTIAWSLTAETPELISLRADWTDYAGGAHPNQGADTLMWDPVEQRPVRREELFLPAGPATAAVDASVDAALCNGIRAVRAHNGVSAAAVNDRSWPCPKWRDAKFTLSGSTLPGKFGGVTFLFDPYAVGPYAEGVYRVTLSGQTFDGLVAKGYAHLFGGDAKP